MWPANIPDFFKDTQDHYRHLQVTYPVPLHEVGNHDDNLNPLLPDESPEGAEGPRQRPLSADVLVPHQVAVDVVGVDVVPSPLARQGAQRH